MSAVDISPLDEGETVELATAEDRAVQLLGPFAVEDMSAPKARRSGT